MDMLSYVMGQKSAGASGGGGGVAPLIVKMTYDADTFEAALDKTYAEIAEAVEAGKRVVVDVPYAFSRSYGANFNIYSELTGIGAATETINDSSGKYVPTYCVEFGGLLNSYNYTPGFAFGAGSPSSYPTYPATAATVDYTYYYQIVDIEGTINIDVSDGTLLTNNASITLPDFSYAMMIYGYNATFGYSGYYSDIQSPITPTTSGVYNNAIGYTSFDAYAEGNYLYAGGISRVGSYDDVFPQTYSVNMESPINLEFSVTITAAS